MPNSNKNPSKDSLNSEQLIAYKGIMELFSPKPKPNAHSRKKPVQAILTGPAGTGKSFLTAHLTPELKPALCALTHKAGSVLSKSLDPDRILPVQTLAKILKQQKINDYNTGMTSFSNGASSLVDNLTVGGVKPRAISLPNGAATLFIDEASMINRGNHLQIQRDIAPFYNILFIGDSYQLPPVGEAYSIALFPEPELEIPHFHLHKPSRFDPNSGIAAIATAIRHGMDDSILPDISSLLQQYDDIEFVHETDAVQMMLEAFKMARNADDVRVISFTNRRVEQFNYHLKKALTGDGEKFVAGDLLYANEAVTRRVKNDKGRFETKLVMNNNESCIIEKLTVVENSKLPHYEIVTEKGVTLLVPMNRLTYESISDIMRDEALSFPSNSAKRKASFKKMFDFKETYSDLRLNYACSVHKSQGSTYQTVFFDLTGLAPDSLLGMQLLYTGITRAATKLVLFK